MQGQCSTLVATMALYKLPSVDANGTLSWSAPIIPNEGHTKYVCLDPWINALVTLASLGTIIAFLMVRCRKRTLCRGLEYATSCHIYVFISKNDRYSPIKLRSTTGLFQYKENYKQRLIQQLLNEDLTLALKGIRLKYKRSTILSRVPKSNKSFARTPSDQFGQKPDSVD